MSDCFNHACDAYDSYDRSMDEGFGYSRSSNYENNFSYDPLFYHKKHEVKLIHETANAYLFKKSKGKFWVAKSLCKKYKRKKGTVWIWTGIEIKYLPN